MSKARQKREPIAPLTYYVVQTFKAVKGIRGKIAAEDPREANDHRHALELVERYRPIRAGVIAFRRTGDPAAGDWEDAVIIARHGQLPSDVDGFRDESDADFDSWALNDADLKVA